ncbi:MAG: Rrf2 family transcriptional regulator [Spirochaetales bacterium]|nr:Rrf2 family transcriptional regulator [Spirochaetales bacterium]
MKSEYALLALIDLCEHEQDGFVRIIDICKRKSIPKKFLEQILLSLKHAGYVESRRGLDGGYRLAKKPSQISLAQVVRLLDGALASVGSVSQYFYKNTPIEKNEKLLHVFREIRDYLSEKMEKTTIDMLI